MRGNFRPHSSANANEPQFVMPNVLHIQRPQLKEAASAVLADSKRPSAIAVSVFLKSHPPIGLGDVFPRPTSQNVSEVSRVYAETTAQFFLSDEAASAETPNFDHVGSR